MSFLLQLLLPEVAILLKFAIKNPQSLATFKNVLTEMVTDIQIILAGLG